jgi:hypothetical protein
VSPRSAVACKRRLDATGTRQLEDLHRRVEPFNGYGPERGGPDVAFRQPQRRRS